MTGPATVADAGSPQPVWFDSTHWTTVLAARDGDSPAGREALEKLCATYWFPLYAFVRRRGHPPAEAEDLTQGFFARFLEKNYLREVRPERGRFRQFLLTALKHYLANEWDRARALKRGGGCPCIPLDQALAEQRFAGDLSEDSTPERAYEQAWALLLLERVHRRLGEEFEAAGKRGRFELLEQFLPGGPAELTYAAVGQRLGLSEGAIKSEAHRLKRRYAELVRLEIAHTVEHPAEIDEELRHLMGVLGG